MLCDFDLFDVAEAMDCKEIHFSVDKPTGMRAIIAIHNTKLGPALGGCRLMAYDTTQQAVEDVVRLAEGMTFKAASAGLNLGGAKAVLLKPKVIRDKEAYFKAFGRFVESLKGRYITAGDLGTSVEDMDIVATQTKHVTGTSCGRYHQSDPSVPTAWGVFHGIQAAVKFKLGKESLKGVHIVIQGLGHVGGRLIAHLYHAGAKLSVFDLDQTLMEKAQKNFQATLLSASEVFTKPCDVFAPCAIGGILNAQTISTLQTSIVAGGANTQLEKPEHAQLLNERDILYAPDYLINAGGLIHVAGQYSGLPEEDTQKNVADIGLKLYDIFTRSKKTGENTVKVSKKMIAERFEFEMS